MNSHLQSVYEEHHATGARTGFSILEKDRGEAFLRWIGTGKEVLDIGCRDGTLTVHFAQGNTVTGADIDAHLLAKLPPEIRGLHMDVYGDWHELEAKKFDAVVAGEILEHLYHPERIVAKVAGRLAEGGQFVGSVPNAFSLKNRFRLFFGRKQGTPLADPTHINQLHIKDVYRMLRKYFAHVEVSGLGRGGWLARRWPGFFAFDLIFRASGPRDV